MIGHLASFTAALLATASAALAFPPSTAEKERNPMDVKERIVRDFYAARDRRDWHAVRELLAPDVVWREGGSEGYSGDHHGREPVAALLAKLVEVTGGTFELEPTEIIRTAEHVAAAVRWRAERDGTRVEGNDLAVFRIRNGLIGNAWFFADGYDPQALGRVFSFGY